MEQINLDGWIDWLIGMDGWMEINVLSLNSIRCEEVDGNVVIQDGFPLDLNKFQPMIEYPTQYSSVFFR